jgi:hypothetical protein
MNSKEIIRIAYQKAVAAVIEAAPGMSVAQAVAVVDAVSDLIIGAIAQELETQEPYELRAE